MILDIQIFFKDFILLQIGNIIFLSIAFYQRAFELKAIHKDIDEAIEKNKADISSNDINTILFKNYSSAILLESIIASFTNSLIIALQILDLVTAIVSVIISFMCLIPFVYFSLGKRYNPKTISEEIKEHIQTLSIYIAFSVIPGQSYYLFISQLSQNFVNTWTIDGLFPFIIGLIASMIALQISAVILKFRRKRYSFR